MKKQFVTDDGKVFENKEEAIAHEAELREPEIEEKKKLMDTVEAINEEIEAYKEKIYSLQDKRDALLKEFETKYLSEDQRKAIEAITSFFSRILGE